MVEFRDCRGELVRWDDDGEPIYPEITEISAPIDPEAAQRTRAALPVSPETADRRRTPGDGSEQSRLHIQDRREQDHP